MPATTNTSCVITNVRPFQSIGLVFPVNVSYALGTAPSGVVAVTCPGANVVPPQMPIQVPPGNPSGTLSFQLTHNVGDIGHTLSATLTQGGVVVASCDITDVVVANTANPNVEGAITITGGESLQYGLPALQAHADLSGTFDPEVGNKVTLLVEEPKVINGVVQPSRLIFADAATVDVEGKPPKGLWKHKAIPNAKQGQRLVIVLTKDGVAKALIQAAFK